MKVELPSGAWVELRDKLMAEDKMAVQGSLTVSIVDGKQEMSSGTTNTFRNALLERIITAWGGGSLEGQPVPSQNIQGAQAIVQLLDLDDYNELEDAVEPLLEKVVLGGPNRGARNTRKP